MTKNFSTLMPDTKPSLQEVLGNTKQVNGPIIFLI
jgi:hypothetical protein